MIHKYLLDEPPLVVLPSLATMIGLNEAIVLQQVHYWVTNAREAKRTSNWKKGRWWVYHSYPEWGKAFPFWSEPTIKRTFLGLEKLGLLLSDYLSSDPRDRSKWYTIDYQALQALIARRTGSDCDGGPDQIDPMDKINLIPCTGSDGDDARTQTHPMHRIESVPSFQSTDKTAYTTSETTTEKPAQADPRSRNGKRPAEKAVVAFEEMTQNSLVEKLCASGITRQIAQELIQNHAPTTISRQIDMLPYRAATDPAAVLVAAIQGDWAAPAAYKEAQTKQRKAQQRQQASERQRQQAEAETAQEAARKKRQDAYWEQLAPAEQARIQEAAAETLRQRNRVVAPSLKKPDPGPTARTLLDAYRREILSAQIGE